MNAVTALFQSTLPMKGVTGNEEGSESHQNVSIHTPNEGSDDLPEASTARTTCFNPHSQ